MDEGLTVLAFDASGGLRHVQTLDDLRLALISNDDGRVYAAAEDGLLLVFQRDAATGRLTEVGTPQALNDVEVLAISDDDRYLFAVSDDGRAQIFGLEDPSSPRHLDSLPPSGDIPSWRYWNCDFAAVRNGNPAMDALCHNLAFSAEWRSDTAELVGTDVVAGSDRFDNEVPTFNNCCDVFPRGEPRWQAHLCERFGSEFEHRFLRARRQRAGRRGGGSWRWGHAPRGRRHDHFHTHRILVSRHHHRRVVCRLWFDRDHPVQ